ncbi:MAG: ribonuclease Z [Clostridia bacterium]|nr:ribonuclease Z [Clostridia bacterium]
MKITIVGSGHGVPEANKQCTSILFEVGGRYYFIDAGCDINMALANRRINPNNVKGIFITHPHNDHIDGLYSFYGLSSWFYKESNPEVYVPNEKCATLVHQYLDAFGAKLRPEQKLEIVGDGVIYDDGYFKVTSFPTQHCPNSHAYLIEAEGKRVLCSGDLKRPAIDFPPVDDLDVAILEAAHFDVKEYIDIIKAKTVKSVYINHYGNYIGRINGEQFLALKNDILPVPAEITTDGMEITL